MSSEKINRGIASSPKWRALSFAALLVVSVGAAGCHQSDMAQLDVTVQIDPALNLDSVTIEFKAHNSASASRTFPVVPAGSPPSPSDVKWPLSIEVLSQFTGTLTVHGKAKDSASDVVTLVADVTIAPKQSLAVTLRLSAACQGKPCTDVDNQTCVDGKCGPHPTYSKGQDAGTDTTAPDAPGSDTPASDGGGGDRPRDGAPDADAGKETGSDTLKGNSSNGTACTTGGDCRSGNC